MMEDDADAPAGSEVPATPGHEAPVTLARVAVQKKRVGAGGVVEVRAARQARRAAPAQDAPFAVSDQEAERALSSMQPAGQLLTHQGLAWEVHQSLLPQESSPPVAVDDTLEAIRVSGDRDQVVRLACQAAATVCRCAALLARRKHVLYGWHAFGLGVDSALIQSLWLPAQGPSVLREVVARAEPYLGPAGSTAVDVLWRAALGSRGGEVLVQPVIVSGRVVAVLYADDLRHGLMGRERITAVTAAATQAFERIIVEGRTVS